MAKNLQDRGYAVTALDIDEEAILQLQTQGVPAVAADFVSYDAAA